MLICACQAGVVETHGELSFYYTRAFFCARTLLNLGVIVVGLASRGISVELTVLLQCIVSMSLCLTNKIVLLYWCA